ncbi:GNAT family N-acetyltransferase [Algoriphagus sp. C2-6-M1]|uniref:GNAT family N-acetyltransferase n=1 Tax=Algoriphagus persicinus TaxID=3108754 RepID=UPI002B3F1D45|nr:GNAT family N-acetyltransferase [Algoriphagus sp. C2-6-M1]MEB2782048.1 GNAT family N-acetyltransferase [Algoriphagus sp. C2-6-M1]
MDRVTIIKPFAELSIEELYAILRFRNEVFVVEQNCIYQDADNKDPLAFHVIIKEDDLLVAYARILPAGISFAEVSIGRVASGKSARGTGAGRKLMQDSLSFIAGEFGSCKIRIGAQSYLLSFYRSLGFEVAGANYLEDGIEHVEMTAEIWN